MLYYGEYLNGRRYVRAYDEEKHGAPRIAGKEAFLYHSAVIVNADNIFTTESAALASWGKYSMIPVVMPDGGEVIPAQYFGNDTPGSVFYPVGHGTRGAMAGRVLNRRKCHYKAGDVLVIVEGIRI